MKLFILLPLIVCSCKTLVPANYNFTFCNSNKVNETNYMKTPCILDGATVKKKPKVINVPANDTH